MGETADPAVLGGRLVEIQVGEGMGLDAARLDAEMLQEGSCPPHAVPCPGAADAEVHVGLAEIHRIELRVGIGDMQNGDISEFGHFVEIGRLAHGGEDGRRHHAGGTGHAEQLNKFATGRWSLDFVLLIDSGAPSETTITRQSRNSP